MSQLTKAYFTLTMEDLQAVEAILDTHFPYHSLIEIDEYKNIWQAEIFSEEGLELETLQTLFPEFDIKIEEIKNQDWLQKSFESFPPLNIGSFYLYGSHITDQPPKDKHCLKLDAATAFGTGEHETTRGCLEALEKISKYFRPESILDMGCGSGILAMGAARLWPNLSDILAVDNDPEAVKVTKYNLKENNLSSQIRAFAGDGYHTQQVKDHKGFDLILSNILAKPLCLMAQDAALKLNVGGVIVLAGLLVSQKDDVLKAYQENGLQIVDAPTYKDWQVLVLKK